MFKIESSVTNNTDSASISLNTITPKSNPNSNPSSECSNISCSNENLDQSNMTTYKESEKMLYFRFNPFVSNDPKESKNPDDYELRLIVPSQDNIHKYIAILVYKNDVVEVYFSHKEGKIYKDRTGYDDYEHMEKLRADQAEQYYQNHRLKIEKKYSSHYFEWHYLMQTSDEKFKEFINDKTDYY